MTRSDVPYLRGPAVADAPKKPAEKPAPTRPLGRASESGDPAVQRLLALVETHQSNGHADKVAEIHDQLAELGYE